MTRETEVVDVKTITKTFCDSCGEMISDGKSDSWGRLSFLGAWAEMEKGNIDKLEIERSGIGQNLYKFHISTEWNDMGSWVLCERCAEGLKDELNERFC